MTFARDETNKVNDRVRIAHATSRRGIKRVRIAHDRTHAKLWPDGPGPRPAASIGLPRRPPPSFPRKRESSGSSKSHWVPAFAGTMEYRGLLSCRRQMDGRSSKRRPSALFSHLRGNDRVAVGYRRVRLLIFVAGTPVKAAFMRPSWHASARRGGLGPSKLSAVPGKAKKHVRCASRARLGHR